MDEKKKIGVDQLKKSKIDVGCKVIDEVLDCLDKYHVGLDDAVVIFSCILQTFVGAKIVGFPILHLDKKEEE